MDPDAALAEMLDIARTDQSEYHDGIHRLCELTLGLHGWLARGGFLPAAWASGRGEAGSPASGSHSPGNPDQDTDAHHEFEPMPGGDVCMYVLASGGRCMKFEGDHQ
ncbi:hypothetical protein Nigel_83 [Mycobacterium phage Nigel]|uniref:Uncharacterized protein n=1 Tax=Mycobacterium phage Nigel TaxID=543152 RepID=B3VM12_9CAUD|nr:HNH endonuclease [Mycobacterium phage Nigel]ACF05086.1 hypothetical protein Nigel_83 [Mycobacterium phage Nigel]